MRHSRSDSALITKPLLSQVSRDVRADYYSFLKAYLIAEAPNIASDAELLAARERRTKALKDNTVHPAIKSPFETALPTAGSIFYKIGENVAAHSRRSHTSTEDVHDTTHDMLCNKAFKQRVAAGKRIQVRSSVMIPPRSTDFRPVDEIRALCASRGEDGGTLAVLSNLKRAHIEAFEVYSPKRTGVDTKDLKFSASVRGMIQSSMVYGCRMSQNLAAVSRRRSSTKGGLPEPEPSKPPDVPPQPPNVPPKATDTQTKLKKNPSHASIATNDKPANRLPNLMNSQVKKRGDLAAVAGNLRRKRVIQRDIQCACDALRLAIYGRIEDKKVVTKKKYLESTIGTIEEVSQLWHMWMEIDYDGDGSVCINEVMMWLRLQEKNADDTFTARRIQLGETSIANLLEAFLATSSGDSIVGIAALMKMIWPCAGRTHITAMKSMIQQLEMQRRRIHTPQLLPTEQRMELVASFKSMDVNDAGFLKAADLVAIGLHPEEVSKMMLEFAHTIPEKGVTVNEFITMMCPLNYLPHRDSKRCLCSEGILVFDDSELFSGWRLSDAKFKVAL